MDGIEKELRLLNQTTHIWNNQLPKKKLNDALHPLRILHRGSSVYRCIYYYIKFLIIISLNDHRLTLGIQLDRKLLHLYRFEWSEKVRKWRDLCVFEGMIPNIFGDFVHTHRLFWAHWVKLTKKRSTFKRHPISWPDWCFYHL